MKDSNERALAAAALIALAAAGFATPAWAQQPCQQWDARGNWTLIQSNQTAASVTLEPAGDGYAGYASFGYWKDDDFWGCSIAACGRDYIVTQGPAVGTLKGKDFELTIYWSDNSIGVYTGQVGPQGLIVGSAYDKNHPATAAQWHSDRVAKCLVAAPAPAASVGFGRIQVPAGTPAAKPRTLCEAAASARARNSPAAPGLERQCREFQARQAASSGTSEVVTDRAFVARPAASAPPPAKMAPPVLAPHDLAIGAPLVASAGLAAGKSAVGVPAAIICNYIVDASANAFVQGIQPWQGIILVGGAVPQILRFQGDRRAGQHEARLAWTPSTAGRAPVSCVLNPGFESAEANPGNNRWNQLLDVMADVGIEQAEVVAPVEAPVAPVEAPVPPIDHPMPPADEAPPPGEAPPPADEAPAQEAAPVP